MCTMPRTPFSKLVYFFFVYLIISGGNGDPCMCISHGSARLSFCQAFSAAMLPIPVRWRFVGPPDHLLRIQKCAQSSGETSPQLVCSCVRQVAGVGRDLGKRAIAGPRSARADLAALAIPVPDPTARSLRMPRQVQQSAVQVQSTTHSYCDAHLAAIWRDFFGQPTVCTVPHS